MSHHLQIRAPNNLPPRYRAAENPGFLYRLIRACSERRKRRQAITQLERLDDKLLADIGILRSEIPQVIDGLNARYASDRPSIADQPAKAKDEATSIGAGAVPAYA